MERFGITSYDIIISAIFFVIAGVIILFFKKRELDNDTASNESLKDKRKKYKNRIVICFFVYIFGISLFLLDADKIDSLGFFVASIGISFMIFYLQNLGNLDFEHVIEKRLGNKIQQINVKQLRRTIANETANKVLEEINIEELKNEIKDELKAELLKGQKEKLTDHVQKQG